PRLRSRSGGRRRSRALDFRADQRSTFAPPVDLCRKTKGPANNDRIAMDERRKTVLMSGRRGVYVEKRLGGRRKIQGQLSALGSQLSETPWARLGSRLELRAVNRALLIT